MAHVSTVIPPFPDVPPPPFYPPDRERVLDRVAGELTTEWLDAVQARSPAIRRQMVLARLSEDSDKLLLAQMVRQYFRVRISYEWSCTYFRRLSETAWPLSPYCYPVCDSLMSYRWLLCSVYESMLHMDDRLHAQHCRMRDRRSVHPRPTAYVQDAAHRFSIKLTKRAIRRVRCMSPFSQRLRLSRRMSLRCDDEPRIDGVMHSLFMRLRAVNKRVFRGKPYV